MAKSFYETVHRSVRSIPGGGRRVCLILVFALLAFASSGCNRQESPNRQLPKGESKSVTTQNATLKATIDRKSLTLAQVLTLSLELTIPEDRKPIFPRPETIGEFAVSRSNPKSAELIDDGRLRHVMTYELEPFLPGNYSVESVDVIVHDSDGKNEVTIKSQPFSVTVTSVIATGDDELRGMTGPAEPPPEKRSWIVYLVSGVVGFVLIWLVGAVVITRVLRRWRKKDPTTNASEVITRNPADVALEAIASLIKEDLARAGQIKEFYLRLSGILRHYVEGRFSIQAPEQTTEEFLVALRNSACFDDDQKSALKEFLTHCDLVKFAKLQASDDDVSRSVDSCRHFVEQTREVSDAI